MKLRKITHSFALTLLLAISAGCAGQPAATPVQPAKQPAYVYTFKEGSGDKKYTLHTLFIIGDAASGAARYTAGAFDNGARGSLATSGFGTYSIAGPAITVKAGGLDAKGTIKPNEYIDLGGHRYAFAMKMLL